MIFQSWCCGLMPYIYINKKAYIFSFRGDLCFQALRIARRREVMMAEKWKLQEDELYVCMFYDFTQKSQPTNSTCTCLSLNTTTNDSIKLKILSFIKWNTPKLILLRKSYRTWQWTIEVKLWNVIKDQSLTISSLPLLMDINKAKDSIT